jgi:hypothetical protein
LFRNSLIGKRQFGFSIFDFQPSIVNRKSSIGNPRPPSYRLPSCLKWLGHPCSGLIDFCSHSEGLQIREAYL